MRVRVPEFCPQSPCGKVEMVAQSHDDRAGDMEVERVADLWGSHLPASLADLVSPRPLRDPLISTKRWTVSEDSGCPLASM